MHKVSHPQGSRCQAKDLPIFSPRAGPNFQFGLSPENTALLSSCALKVLPPKHLGDPPPSLCLGINLRFYALICWRKSTFSE